MPEYIIEQIWDLIGTAIDLLFIISIIVRLHKHDKAIKELQEYRKYEQQWEYEEQQRSQYYQTREVKPGSAEHYEKWKAERQNREP